MHIDGRLSDALNRREAIAIADVSWAPVDGSGPFTPVPGLKSVDPYDLIVVLAGEGTLPPLSEAERAAHKIHKVPYDCVLEAPPFRITGTVYLFAGTEPERLLDRGDRDVRAGGRCGLLPRRRSGWARARSRSSWSTASTCGASSRSTSTPARAAADAAAPGPAGSRLSED